MMAQWEKILVAPLLVAIMVVLLEIAKHQHVCYNTTDMQILVDACGIVLSRYVF